MKYLRFYIIGFLTLIGLIYILFIFKPQYLYKYKNNITIEYNVEKIDGYEWQYEIKNNNFKLSSNKNDKWTFTPSKDGSDTITFYYFNPENPDEKYKYKVSYDFKIEGNKIYCLSGMGYGLHNFPFPY